MLTNLITNFHKLTKDGKQSYFGKKWGAEAGLKKTIDRQDYTFDDVSNASPAKQLSEHILNAYQATPDSERSHFVEKITNDSLSFLAKRQGMRLQQLHAEAICNESMVAVIGRIFDRLEQYSLEFNAYLGCTELQTVVTRPEHVREIVKFSKSRQPLEAVTFFRARLASPTWALVVRGKNGKIDFFLLPVARVMGLSKSEELYEPICSLNANVCNKEVVVWELEDRLLTPNREQEIAMEMFARLIDRTRSQMDDDSMSEPELELGA
jgi:hypothetical protein